MRLLFQLPTPQYLRFYGSTLRALGERGHEVLVAYDAPGKHRAHAHTAAEQAPGVDVVDALPEPEGRLAAVKRELRLGADYVRYLGPEFGDAPYLRERMERFAPASLPRLRLSAGWGRRRVGAAIAVLRAADDALPADRRTVAALRAHSPDAVLVSPLIARGASSVRQTETVRAARRLGIPVAAGISSWDHLTSKGLIKARPHAVLVWNDAQRDEAVRLHGVPAQRVVVTGAQPFDHWFEHHDLGERAAFLAGVGLGDGPFVLFTGSSPNIAPGDVEPRFVRRWVAALRASSDPAVRRLGVLVRPHPANLGPWSEDRLGDLHGVAVSPRVRPAIPMTPDEELHFRRSLAFSSGVVGVNTSAMIEAAILGRVVHTVRAPEFRATQEGTLHFRHLLGVVRSARNLDEHLEQLAATLADPGAWTPHLKAFVESFVRRHGLERPAAPIVADALEDLALKRRSPARTPGPGSCRPSPSAPRGRRAA